MNLITLNFHKEFYRIQKQCKNTFLVNISFPGQKEGKIFFDSVYNSQKKRIFNALKNSNSDSVIKFKDVLKKIIDGK